MILRQPLEDVLTLPEIAILTVETYIKGLPNYVLSREDQFMEVVEGIKGISDNYNKKLISDKKY